MEVHIHANVQSQPLMVIVQPCRHYKQILDNLLPCSKVVQKYCINQLGRPWQHGVWHGMVPRAPRASSARRRLAATVGAARRPHRHRPLLPPPPRSHTPPPLPLPRRCLQGAAAPAHLWPVIDKTRDALCSCSQLLQHLMLVQSSSKVTLTQGSGRPNLHTVFAVVHAAPLPKSGCSGCPKPDTASRTSA